MEGEYLRVDQSALTGESPPVERKAGDAAYSGSVARMAERKAVVAATGVTTYLRITTHRVLIAGTVSHFVRGVLRIGGFLILSTLGLVAPTLGVSTLAAVYR